MRFPGPNFNAALTSVVGVGNFDAEVSVPAFIAPNALRGFTCFPLPGNVSSAFVGVAARLVLPPAAAIDISVASIGRAGTTSNINPDHTDAEHKPRSGQSETNSVDEEAP